MSQTWNIDPSHSQLEFAVKHMAISTVRGRFRVMSGSITTSEDGSLQGVEVNVDTSSIDTLDPNRDTHLKSPDFFDASTHPGATFKSTTVERSGDNVYRVAGDLTIRGTTKPVTLEVETTDPITDPWGNLRAAAEGKAKINRKEWGLNWNQVLELGALLVSDDVRLNFEVQAVRPKAA
jgi:polyisoprenoid-binding protein YceI